MDTCFVIIKAQGEGNKPHLKYKGRHARQDANERKTMKKNRKVLERISSEYKLSSATLRRYAVFGRGLDQLEKRYPGTRNRILTGKLEVARVHMTDLLSMPQSELREMIDNPKCRRLVPPKQEKAENRIANGNTRTKVIRLNTGIKQMPAFDPDAELKGLTFTVSAWKNAVSRAKEKTDFNKATVVGRYRLKHAFAFLHLAHSSQFAEYGLTDF